MNFCNKYITTFLSLLCIFTLGYLNNNVNINVYNNIFFKILYLILIFIIIDKDFTLGLLLGINYLIIDQLYTYNKLRNDLNELEHLNQLEHYTQDYLVENNII